MHHGLVHYGCICVTKKKINNNNPTYLCEILGVSRIRQILAPIKQQERLTMLIHYLSWSVRRIIIQSTPNQDKSVFFFLET